MKVAGLLLGVVVLAAVSGWNDCVAQGTLQRQRSSPPPIEDAAHAAPFALAAADQSVAAGSLVTLDGSGSRGAHPLSYRWEIVSRPTGSETALSDPATSKPQLFADIPGDFILALTVTDTVTGLKSRANLFLAVQPAYTEQVIATGGAILNAVGDFNGDGRVDLIVTFAASFPDRPRMYLYSQEADGSYARRPIDATANMQLPIVAAVGDLDGDGTDDLVLADVFQHCLLTVLRGRADGGFGPAKTVVRHVCSSPVLQIVDFDNDGIKDLASLGPDGLSAVYYGSREGTFTEKTTRLPEDFKGGTMAVADFDGDGVQDRLAIVPGNPWTLSIWFGAGAGQATVRHWQKPDVARTYSPRSPSVLLQDVNGDGLLDVLYMPGGSTGSFMALLATARGRFDSDPVAVHMGSGDANVILLDTEGVGHLDAVSIGPRAVLQIRRGDGQGHWGPAFDALAGPTGALVPGVNRVFAAGKTNDGRAILAASKEGRLVIWTPR